MKRVGLWIALGVFGLLVMIGWSLLPVFVPELADPDWSFPYGMMGGYFNHPVGVWWMPLGMLGMGAFWVCVVVIVIRAIRGTPETEKEQGMRILKERLARGEVSIDEFERLRDALRERR
jgi:putative membrane protein